MKWMRFGRPTSGLSSCVRSVPLLGRVGLRRRQKIWDAPLDTSHESNPLGGKKNIEKTYNSYHPRDGAEK